MTYGENSTSAHKFKKRSTNTKKMHYSVSSQLEITTTNLPSSVDSSVKCEEIKPTNVRGKKPFDHTSNHICTEQTNKQTNKVTCEVPTGLVGAVLTAGSSPFRRASRVFRSLSVTFCSETISSSHNSSNNKRTKVAAE